MEKSGQGCSSRQRVVLVPAPFQGHLNPMLYLGSILHSKGFSITVAYINFNSPDPSNHPDFQFLQIPFDPSELLRICRGDYITFLLMLTEHCESPLLECLSQIEEKQDASEKISCVIHDEVMSFSSAAATHLKLPSIILRTSCSTTFISRLCLLHLNIEDLDSEELVPELPYPIRFKDLPLNTLGTFENFLKLVVNVENTRNSSAVIFNTMEFLEEPSLAKIRRESHFPIFPIGPMHKIVSPSAGNLLEEDRGCLLWLNKQADNSVLYVSMGSVASMEEKDVTEIAWGLANSKQPVLCVVRPGSIKGSEWIERLPEGLMEAVRERGCFVKWAPQKEVLAHPAVGGFWSHCGWNSTVESLSEGVPMICQPCFGDQKVNARCMSHVWKVGLELRGNLERGEVEKTVKRLMVEDAGEEMRKRAMDLKRKVEISIGEGGSSYSSVSELVGLIMSF
ncbi:hypothetical protein SLA2020_393140 [Shorea laevis]